MVKMKLYYKDLFLQTAFLKEKGENHGRVGGDGPEKRNGVKIISKFITHPFIYMGKSHF